MKKYRKKWKVPSRSDSSKVYTVSLTEDGSYECSCPAWIFRREECPHIRLVKTQVTLDGSDFGEEEIKPLVIVHAKVREVTKHGHELYVPLLPLPPPTHFWATICYDLNKFGLSWREIKAYYRLPDGWTREKVREYIRVHGRCIETEESLNSSWGSLKTEVTREGIE